MLSQKDGRKHWNSSLTPASNFPLWLSTTTTTISFNTTHAKLNIGWENHAGMQRLFGIDNSGTTIPIPFMHMEQVISNSEQSRHSVKTRIRLIISCGGILFQPAVSMIIWCTPFLLYCHWWELFTSTMEKMRNVFIGLLVRKWVDAETGCMIGNFFLKRSPLCHLW